MLSYVVPMFQDIFKQNNMELPMLTKLIVKLSDVTKSFGGYGILLLIAFIIIANLLKDNAVYKNNTLLAIKNSRFRSVYKQSVSRTVYSGNNIADNRKSTHAEQYSNG